MSEYDLANINIVIVDDYQPIRYILRASFGRATSA